MEFIGIDGVQMAGDNKSTVLLDIPPQAAACTISVAPNDNGGAGYIALLYGPIMKPSAYTTLERICVKATDKDTIDVYVDSPGGSVTIAVGICSFLALTKAKVRRIAIGDVMSAATIIIDGADTTYIGKYAHFMYHMSTNGGLNKTTKMIGASQLIFKYIVDYLKRAVKRGCITMDEAKSIVNQECDVYITGPEMANRLKKQLFNKNTLKGVTEDG